MLLGSQSNRGSNEYPCFMLSPVQYVYVATPSKTLDYHCCVSVCAHEIIKEKIEYFCILMVTLPVLLFITSNHQHLLRVQSVYTFVCGYFHVGFVHWMPRVWTQFNPSIASKSNDQSISLVGLLEQCFAQRVYMCFCRDIHFQPHLEKFMIFKQSLI